MFSPRLLFPVLVAVLAVSRTAAAEPPAPAGVDQARVDRAIDAGARALLGVVGDPASEWSTAKHRPDRELILYTLVHAGTPRDNPVFVKLLDEILDDPLKRTYNVSLQAMALEALDREYFRPRLAQCAQFLADNQCENGQWSYGEPIATPKLTLTAAPPPPPPKAVATGAASPAGGASPAAAARAASFAPSRGTSAARPLPRIAITPARRGPPSGDNSNTQYAALGLRACLQARIEVPAATLAKAETWWEKCQNGDGGWDYRHEGTKLKGSYGSMTVGAVGSLAIYDFLQKKDFKRDPRVARGLTWIGSNYALNRNPGKDREKWHYYYLYGLERAGILAGTETFGAHRWYAEGASLLLDAQGGDGFWKADQPRETDTCFAILFLKRATKPLTAVYTQ